MVKSKFANCFNAICFIIVVVSVAGCGKGGDPRISPAKKSDSQPSLMSCRDSTEYLTADYYVDAAAGDDSKNDGLSPGAAWKTLGKALSSSPGGKVVHVANGDYGLLQETTPSGRSSYLTIRAAPGASPRISGINITYTTKASALLRIVGFKVENYSYDPNNSSLVTIGKATDVELLNDMIVSDSARGSGYAIASTSPGNPSTIDGVGIDTVDNLLIQASCITGVMRGIQIANSSGISILRNYISPQAGTGIQYLSNNHNVLIEDNHIQGMSFTAYPDDPNAILDPHASVISIRSNDVTIRNNIMHGMGSSSGIMFYLPDAAGGLSAYSNITIEGNLLYDITNPSVLRFYGVADNLLVRNNIVISQYATGTCNGLANDARFRYSSGLTVHTVAAGKDGSGLTIANNIIVGATFLNGALANDINNIFWSFSPAGTTYSASSLSGTSKVVADTYGGCGVFPNYFETDFFTETPNFNPQHGGVYRYLPSSTSDAVNFGDLATTLARKLGTLDGNGVFINAAGNRAAGEHSAGAYEP